MALATVSPAELFANYTQRRQPVPPALWMLLRGLVLALALGEIVLLFVAPRLGLTIFWSVAVPCLPALWAIAPGIWRQVCPMAFLNQLPRLAGREVERALPQGLRYWSYLIGVALLVAMVALRRPLLNVEGWATGAMCAAALVAAWLGGLLYKGRSGWCGTFCPLAPVQRSHGQAPVFVVPNGYCPTCVGCQKNCLDFNPRAAIHGDIADTDPRHSAQRLWFMAMLPGLIVGYFTLGDVLAQQGPWVYFAALAAGMSATAGLYFLLRALLPYSAYRVVSLFGAAALLLYYAWAGPVLVGGVTSLLGLEAPEALVMASRWIGLPVVWGVWRASLAGERAYQALERAEAVRIDDSRLKAPGRTTGGPAVIEVLERQSGKRVASSADKTLLEALEAAGVPIDFGCRSGLCGADAVGIVEGHEHLDEPGADEAATLRRLGLSGRARLACCARTCGSVVVDRDPRSVPPVATAATAAPRVDHALAAGVQRVLVVGNGVAGMTAAEALRSLSASAEITVVAEESHHFYNRMALGRVVYNRNAMQGMFLVPDAWYAEQRVNVWLNTVAIGIDRQRRQLRLGTGESLPYDRLVLATGARAASPGAGYDGADNAFVLRSAADAQAIRAAAQRISARRAVVIGGGVLGVEAAEALHQLGLQVGLLHRGARLMDRQLDAEGAQRLQGYLENSGVAVVTEARIAGFEGQGHVDAVLLEDGRRLEADLLVACTGVVPNAELARAAGLAVGRGIRVDADGRTDDEAIYAVGDVAEPATAGPLGLWPVAVEQARRAATAMLQASPEVMAGAASRIVLQLKSDGIDLRSYGNVEAVPEGAEVLCADAAAVEWWRLVVLQGQVLAAVYVGPPGTAKALTRVLQSGASVERALPALRQHQLGLAAA
jgi:nitrite reductase (NADH) large subunit